MDEEANPRADSLAALLWLVIGAVILQQSWAMDRLEVLGVEPWSAPGVVPGIIGTVLMILAVILLVRSRSRLRSRPEAVPQTDAAETRRERWRLAVALLMCALFVFGWLSLRLPFWLGAALFVAAAVLVFATPSDQGKARRVTFAVGFGLAAGILVQLLFQDVFLVRLP